MCFISDKFGSGWCLSRDAKVVGVQHVLCPSPIEVTARADDIRKIVFKMGKRIILRINLSFLAGAGRLEAAYVRYMRLTRSITSVQFERNIFP